MLMTNDNTTLVPQTNFTGRMLEFDLPGVAIGVAEYAEGPTGCTVFHFPAGAQTAIDVRGGMVGKTGDYDWNHAICLAGGSLPGLEAAAGVSAELFAHNNYDVERFPLVSGAIIYDYGQRNTVIYPDKALGRAALQAAKPGIFPLGARGVGRSAGCGAIFEFARREPSGQGGAFRQIGQTKVAVFTVVNALGVILDRAGKVVRGNLAASTGQRRHPDEELTERITNGQPTNFPGGNTTLTVLITNQMLDNHTLEQLARQTHSAMARAIYPFHTIMDGDVLYAISTHEVENPALSSAALGMIAGDLAWEAILSS